MSQRGSKTAEDRDWCVHLPAELRKPTKILAAKQDIPMYDVIVLALRDYLKKEITS